MHLNIYDNSWVLTVAKVVNTTKIRLKLLIGTFI